ncbi:MAG TPA: L,D-transpeptidase family protein [Baekduia sp.]|nr:L,D-transpeptidase family protein [Baekduia sp.]
MKSRRSGLLTAIAFLCAFAPTTARAEPLSPNANSPTGATLTMSVTDAGREAAVVQGKSITAHGVVVPFQAGQTATVTFTQRGKVVQETAVPITDAGNGSGYFDVAHATKQSGLITIKAVTTATPVHPSLTEDGIEVTVLSKRVRDNAKGASVRELQRLLKRKGYVVGKSGVYDARTARAVMAFRKVTGMRRNFSADASVLRALAKGRGRFRVKFPKHGRHVEADISRQVMVFADGEKVLRIYHVSTGSPVTPTIRGSFRVYRKDPGTNAKGMVDSSYFIGGYAIHGYAQVPAYNASHGCLRVPVPDARSIFDWVQMGTRVDTYL